jgi:tRNA1Val (adenine37-N6)-methyltransferase
MVITARMANNYFQFKQFTVYQDKCAMKVTTDGCLFGAWVAALMRMDEHDCLLDIGAGTGLLSLMAAQKNKCRIDAVEIDKAAFVQACENAAQSPWAERINIINADIRQWPAERKYNCIISNPPFFENQLASPDAGKNKALHAHELSLAELFAAFDKNIIEGGKIFLLMPAYRKAEVISTANEHGYFIEQVVMVKQTPLHEPFRMMLELLSGDKTHIPIGERPNDGAEETLTIRQSNNEYSDEFISLLKEYYLYL